MKAKLEKKCLAISLPLLVEHRPSKSGKSLLIASSRGARKTAFAIDGRPVYVSASAFIRKRDSRRTKETSRNE